MTELLESVSLRQVQKKICVYDEYAASKSRPRENELVSIWNYDIIIFLVVLGLLKKISLVPNINCNLAVFLNANTCLQIKNFNVI